ncbi:MAG: nuclear transport factor 2 family protein [Myxococcota bacterium]|nr:nuclear transport factor 2 family protein [Myxococcota bacterium]
MDTNELEGTLRALADKEAIRDLARLYAHHVWQRDLDPLVELFTEDGEMDTSLEEPIHGRKALREAFQRLVEDEGSDLQPFVHNHVVELDGDRASGTAYVDLRSIRDGQSMMGSGFYRDRYVRQGQAWKFESRRLELRFFVPLHEGWAGGGEG